MVFLAHSSRLRFVRGYSLLTHEQIVDCAWKDDIQPLLKKRFPGRQAEDFSRPTRMHTAAA